MVTVTCDMAFPHRRYEVGLKTHAGPPQNKDNARNSPFVGLQHRTNAVHGGVDAPRNFAIGVFQMLGARRGGIEVAGELGAIAAERMQLRGQALLATVRLAAALDRGFQCIERKRKPLGCAFYGRYIAHAGNASTPRAAQAARPKTVRRQAVSDGSLRAIAARRQSFIDWF